jgi:hypothetical protein
MGDEFMTVSGIALRRSRAGEITRTPKGLNETHNGRGEIKWRNVRKGDRDIRKAYINYLAKLVRDNHVHFHIRSSPMNEYEHHGDRHIFDTVSKSSTNCFCTERFGITARIPKYLFARTTANALAYCLG